VGNLTYSSPPSKALFRRSGDNQRNCQKSQSRRLNERIAEMFICTLPRRLTRPTSPLTARAKTRSRNQLTALREAAREPILPVSCLPPGTVPDDSARPPLLPPVGPPHATDRDCASSLLFVHLVMADAEHFFRCRASF